MYGHPGCSQHSLAEETDAEVADAMLRLNTLAPIALTRAALPVTALRVVALCCPATRPLSHIVLTLPWYCPQKFLVS